MKHTLADAPSRRIIRTPESEPSPYRYSVAFRKCGRAFCEWLAHTLLICGILGCIALTEWALKWFLQSPNPRLFDVIPVSWIFHAADGGVLIGLSYYGVKAAVAAYNGQYES
ncbi:MAG TPA: hypothetical protein VLC46_24940 [Thermoanaerobaculia bacterium]|nr:hypothetical protein [Thermoanaerobaculia bacterium]